MVTMEKIRTNIEYIFTKLLHGEEITTEEYSRVKWYIMSYIYCWELMVNDKTDIVQSVLFNFKRSNPKNWDVMDSKHKYCYFRKCVRRTITRWLDINLNMTQRHPILILKDMYDDDYDVDDDNVKIDKELYPQDTVYSLNHLQLEAKEDIEKEVNDKITCEYIYEYVKCLSSQEQEIFNLHFIDWFSNIDISNMLGISRELVRQRIKRVKDKITTNFNTKWFIY